MKHVERVSESAKREAEAGACKPHASDMRQMLLRKRRQRHLGADARQADADAVEAGADAVERSGGSCLYAAASLSYKQLPPLPSSHLRVSHNALSESAKREGGGRGGEGRVTLSLKPCFYCFEAFSLLYL